MLYSCAILSHCVKIKIEVVNFLFSLYRPPVYSADVHQTGKTLFLIRTRLSIDIKGMYSALVYLTMTYYYYNTIRNRTWRILSRRRLGRARHLILAERNYYCPLSHVSHTKTSLVRRWMLTFFRLYTRI